MTMPALVALTNLNAARWQMTVSLAFHIVFAAIGIGLPLLFVVVEWLYVRTGRDVYRALAAKWVKATGLLFAVGAISGTALAFELGLLWPRYIQITGAAVGHLFALEGYAFFIEAIFIGLYLYGRDRLSHRALMGCAVVIALSGAASGVLVLGVNAWMQVPIGFQLAADGTVTSTAPLAIFGTYAWRSMAMHSTLSCYMAVGFGVAGVYAIGYLRGRRDDYHRAAMRVALAIGAAAAILQPVCGDLLAKFVYRTQPAKFAAMESHYQTAAYAPIRFGPIQIPGLLSFLATHDFSTTVKGLDDIDASLRPNVELTHSAFDIMAGIGALLAVLSVWFFLRWWRRRDALFDSRRLLRAIAMAGPLGFIALEAGWIVTEAGRQPWAIQGYLRTADAVTPYRNVEPFLIGFIVLYLVLGLTVVLLLRRLGRDRPNAEAAA
jgi:cytochrome d ubiquinol oxidase subunit I